MDINMLEFHVITLDLLFNICTDEISEMFVYKQSETTEYVKN